jgi:ribosome-binding factor A
MSSSRRQRQVGELLHEEISRMLQREVKDPRLGFVTVTGVDVSPDLRHARVFVTVLGDAADAKEALAGLASAASYFRSVLRHSLSLRYIPELTFKLDTSLEQGMRIEALLDTIEKEQDNVSDKESDGQM